MRIELGFSELDHYDLERVNHRLQKMLREHSLFYQFLAFSKLIQLQYTSEDQSLDLIQTEFLVVNPLNIPSKNPGG